MAHIILGLLWSSGPRARGVRGLLIELLVVTSMASRESFSAHGYVEFSLDIAQVCVGPLTNSEERTPGLYIGSPESVCK